MLQRQHGQSLHAAGELESGQLQRLVRVQLCTWRAALESRSRVARRVPKNMACAAERIQAKGSPERPEQVTEWFKEELAGGGGG